MASADGGDHDCSTVDGEVQCSVQHQAQLRQSSGIGTVHIRGVGCVIDDGNTFITIVTFSTTALASGIIGNAAYDALKATLTRLASRSQNGAPDVGYGRELIARLATQARCAEAGLPVPRSTAPCKIQWDANESGYTYHLKYCDLAAKVVIPKGELDGRTLEVTLYAQHNSNSQKID